jgi:hypothetical protein
LLHRNYDGDSQQGWSAPSEPPQVDRSGFFWLAGAGLLAIFRLVPFLPPEVNSFAGGHYLFSYSAGFHKRALPGALLSTHFERLTAATIYSISLCTLAAFTVALVLFMRKALLSSRATFVLGLVLLGSPAILPHFAYSLGYFDPLLVICALLALAVFATPLPEWLKVPLAFLPCAIGVLIHESFVLAAFPVVIACTLMGGKSRAAALCALAFLVVTLTALVQLHGQPSIPLDRYMTEAAARTDVKLNFEAFEFLYFQPRQNFSYLLQHYSSVLTDARLLAGLIVPIPYFLLLRDLFRATVDAAGLPIRMKLWIAGCILAPLALLLVGFDALRWASFACLNCSILICQAITADRSGAVEKALSRYVFSVRFMTLALLSFAVAPLHVVDGNAIATGVHSIARGLRLVQW